MKTLRSQLSRYQAFQDHTLGSAEARHRYVSVMNYLYYIIGLYLVTNEKQSKEVLFENIKTLYVALEVPFNFDVIVLDIKDRDYSPRMEKAIAQLVEVDNYEQFSKVVSEVLSLVFSFIHSKQEKVSK